MVAIELSRNFGQHIAVSAGLDFATADYVIVLDSDLEDPPSAIPAIIEQLEGGADFVYTRRASQPRRAVRTYLAIVLEGHPRSWRPGDSR